MLEVLNVFGVARDIERLIIGLAVLVNVIFANGNLDVELEPAVSLNHKGTIKEIFWWFCRKPDNTI